jgi:diguanylate cyclase (GGDEF)-like protein
LHAVVSYYDPYIDPRRGALFVQDASGGVFVSLPARPILAIKPGDLVAITGVTGPGDYAAIVTAAQVLPVGQSRLPARPLKTTLMQLLTGAFDCQWVEVEGRVRSAHLGPGNVVLGVAANGGSLTAVTVRQPGVDYEALVDSLVRIDGVAAPVFNQRRQMVGVRVFFPTLRQTNVIQPAPRDPFTAPTVSIYDLFRNSAVHGLLHRVHVRGTVTLDWPGLMLCIQDGKSGICMQTAQAASVPVGSFVDVVGFPAINLFKPTLEDAVFRTAVGAAAPASLVPITADQAITGDLDGRLVQIDAELIGRNLAAADPTLMLRAGRLIFPVILPRDATLGAVTWKDGSVLRITGVCNTQIDSLNSNLLGGPVRLQSVHVLLRSIDDISLLQAPSWWTSQHALESFAVVGLVVLAAFAWIIILRYRVKLQTRALRASEDRLRHLSEHDALTGLPNRILLNDRLQTALKRAERFQTCLGVLLVDVDGFKEVNDALGHQAGDTLLCHLAARFNNCVRATDTVGRLGGDEFVVLLPDLLFPAEAANIAAKIVSAVSDPLAIDRTLVVITASIGVVTYPEGSASPEALMQCADEAMYAAKEKGKNGFQVYRPKPAASAGEGGSVLGPAPHFALPTGRA